jgi:diguanylate cyclase (GGDEF)-like protein
VLIKVAALVRESLRENDIPGRYGGEEFGIVLVNTPKDGALVVAERIRASIENTPVLFEGGEIMTSASLGVADYQSGIKDVENFIAQADAALYRAKQQGRNCVVSFDAIEH